VLKQSTWTNAIFLELRVFEKDTGQRRDAGFHGIYDGGACRGSFCFSYICPFRGWIICSTDVKVVKVRLQLQGSYNNPAFFSGYNYKSTFHAIKTVRPRYLTVLIVDYSDRVGLCTLLRISCNYASRSPFQRSTIRVLRTIQTLVEFIWP
jgi:hypothetical protein